MKYLMILLVVSLSACGGAQYGTKGSCDAAFAALDPKVAVLTNGSSTLADVKAALGEPTYIYPTKTVGVEDYQFLISTDHICGQYRVQIQNGKTFAGVDTYKDYQNK